MDKQSSQPEKPETLDPASGMLRKLLSRPLIHSIIIIALGFIIYMGTFPAPFVFDDLQNIVHNPALRDTRYFTDRALQDKAVVLSGEMLDEHFRSRIVGYLTLALNYKLHGVKVQGYHIFNVLVHLANAILVYLLVLLTSRTPWFRKAAGDTDDPHSYRMAALFAALLFVSHPIQTQAVTYITQRFTALATMFCLLSLVMYARCRLAMPEGGKDRTRPEHGGWRFSVPYGMSVLSAVLAMKTKEMSFTLPVIIALYEVMFFGEKTRKRLLYLLPLLLTMLIVPLAVLADRAVLTDMKNLEASVQAGQGENSALSYLLTQFRVIVTYLRLLVLPVNQNLDYDYPVYHSFFNPAVFLSFIFLAGIFTAGAYFYRRSGSEGVRSRQWLRVAAFGIFWFFIMLSVESSIIPLLDIIFEHRLYLPSAGFFMVVVSAAAIGKSRFGKTGSRAITLFLTFTVLILSVAAFQRNQVWGDTIRLWEDVVRKSPYKARPHNALGVAYDHEGQTSKAIDEYLAALRIEPNYHDAHNNLGVIYDQNGQTDKAINEYLAAIKIKPDFYDAHNNLGVAYGTLGQTDKAVNEFLTALKIMPDFVEAHINLGIIYQRQGQTDKASNEFAAAIKIDPACRSNMAVKKFQEDSKLKPQDTGRRQ